MPRGDGTGPAGFGPISGRGLGYCAGYAAPGYQQGLAGRGFWGCSRVRGGGSGAGGNGWRNRFFATGQPGWQHTESGMGANQELASLKAQAEQLQSTLDAVRKRIDDLLFGAPKD